MNKAILVLSLFGLVSMSFGMQTSKQINEDNMVINAVQNQRIQTLETTVANLTIDVQTIQNKMNWMLGGLGGIYMIITLVGISNILSATSKRDEREYGKREA